MSYFRRFRGPGSEDEEDAAVERDDSSLARFSAYSLNPADESGRINSDPLPEENDDAAAEDTQPESGGGHVAPTAGGDPAVYGQLGEHVSTVLSSADEAAKRLQESAAEEAARIRAEAERYAEKTRASADAYAEERREAAETEASKIVSKAETRVRELREAAEQEAADIKREAVRRRESLFQESERAEERLLNLLQVFRAMTERLEDLVGVRADAPGGASTKEGEASDEDLAERLVSRSRSSSREEPRAAKG